MHTSLSISDTLGSAKYIEGLENRLGRMESLLRLSGLLSEDDNGKTDLGTLEKRLADRTNTLNMARNAKQFTAPGAIQQTSTSRIATPVMDSQSSPRTAATTTSPESQNQSEGEVEALSDMMCSLVTNNCGETRYIGTVLYKLNGEIGTLTMVSQGLPPDSRSFLQRAFNGSTKRQEILHSKK